MSAISVILLLAAGLALALCGAALRVARSLRDEVAALRTALTGTPGLPPARTVPDEELIRAAVADALADERERELAEARAFWAEQEAREADGTATGPLLAGRLLGHVDEADEALLDALLEDYLPGDDGPEDDVVFVPRQGAPEAAPLEAVSGEDESAELAAARRRHPSHPGYNLAGEPVSRRAAQPDEADDTADAEDAAEFDPTTERLSQLAEAATPLADVRPGPLGTLDIFLFEDGTTLCLSPGNQETARRLAAAVAEGRAPTLLGGSGVYGAYALTFSCGDESVYLLADRVVTA